MAVKEGVTFKEHLMKEPPKIIAEHDVSPSSDGLRPPTPTTTVRRTATDQELLSLELPIRIQHVLRAGTGGGKPPCG
jgi:hypothetical protein